MRLYHPTTPGVSVDVPDKSVKRWKRSGWLDTDPAAKSSAPSRDADSTNQAPLDAANEKE